MSALPSDHHNSNEHITSVQEEEECAVMDTVTTTTTTTTTTTEAPTTIRQQQENENNDNTMVVDIEFLVIKNNGVKVLYKNNSQNNDDTRRKKAGGRIMVATRDFGVNELYNIVLSERPALICRANDMADFMHQFVNNTSIDVQCAILDMAHNDSSPLGRALAEPAQVLSVLFAQHGYGGPDGAAFIQKLLCIYMTNAHDYFDNTTALFLMGSKINHSCCPNVGYTCRRRQRLVEDNDVDSGGGDGGGDDGVLEYRLLRPIQKGEEIVFSYLSDLYETPTLERRSILLESKWFLCQCERCNGPDYCRIMNTTATKSSSRIRTTIACEACDWTSGTTTTQTTRLPCRYDDDYNPSWTMKNFDEKDEKDNSNTRPITCPKCGASTRCGTRRWEDNDGDHTGSDDTVATTTTSEDANVLVARERSMEECLQQIQETMELLVMGPSEKIDDDNNNNNNNAEDQQPLPTLQELKGIVQQASNMLSPLHYLALKAQLLYMVCCASQKTLQIQYLQQQQQQQQQEFELQQALIEEHSNNKMNKRGGNPKKIKYNNNKMKDTAAKKENIMLSEMESYVMHHHHPSVYTVAVQGCKAGFVLVMAAECIAANCTGCFPGHLAKGNQDRKKATTTVTAADVVFRHEPLWDRAVCMLDICTDLCQLPAFCWPWYAVTLTQRYMPILRAKFGSCSKQVQEIQRVLIDPWRLVDANEDNRHTDSNNNNTDKKVDLMFCEFCSATK